MTRTKGIGLGIANPNADYYAVALTADQRGKIERSVFSHFVGWADAGCRIELRTASVVNVERMSKVWCELGQSSVIVNTESELEVFIAILGGHGFIVHELVRKYFPELLKSAPFVRVGVVDGFSGEDPLLAQAARRHPTPSARMKIIRRDDHRCRVCGRRPEDALDLRLHVHHIQDYAKGGPTLPWNLITLCQTCHDGIAEADQPRLYDSLGAFDVDVSEHTCVHLEGVARYREVMQQRN
jgi:hypothetical protein